MRLPWLTLAALLAPLLASCGGKVVIDAQNSNNTPDAGPDSDAPKTCGGYTGVTCAPDEWCQFSPAGTCGVDDGSGICQPKPQGCDDDCPGVCGCDGQFYCNDCTAHSAGVDVSHGDCPAPSPITYSAHNMFTAVPRFVVFKTDPVRDICVRLIVEATGGWGGIGIQTTTGWAVSKAEITNHASDCTQINGYPAPPTDALVSAKDGAGTLVIQNFNQGEIPCQIDLHAKLAFPSGSPDWVPLSEPLDTTALPVDGGCN